MELQTRKRREKDGDGDREGGEKRKKTAPHTIKIVEKKVVLSDAHATTTDEEEEVEEFYAIVRRMQATVKYFEKDTNNAGGDQVRWRAALESTLPVVDADVVDDHVIKTAASDHDHEADTDSIADDVNNVVLDLNQAPVEEPETPT